MKSPEVTQPLVADTTVFWQHRTKVELLDLVIASGAVIGRGSLSSLKFGSKDILFNSNNRSLASPAQRSRGYNVDVGAINLLLQGQQGLKLEVLETTSNTGDDLMMDGA